MSDDNTTNHDLSASLAAATHLQIDPALVGTPLTLSADFASVQLETTSVMAADERGLVHGGFLFGMADYAAMLAVNDVNVVLGGAEVRLLLPCKVGDIVIATAHVLASAGKKRKVDVHVMRGDATVMQGTFQCFVLPHHVLGEEKPTTTQQKLHNTIRGNHDHDNDYE